MVFADGSSGHTDQLSLSTGSRSVALQYSPKTALDPLFPLKAASLQVGSVFTPEINQ